MFTDYKEMSALKMTSGIAMKTILCAIDFSESSLHTLKYTMSMAQLYHAQVTVLYCYRLISADKEGESLYMKRDMEASALEQFKEIEKQLTHTGKGSYEFVSEVGFFPSRIESFMRKTPVSLLVIGNSIVENFNEYKSLSFDEFLRETKVPVVIVPPENNHKS